MTPEAYRLKPWTDVVRPHEDIISGRLEMSTYAADLGAVDRKDKNAPRVYRDAGEFFRTTYPTENLRKLLTDVMGAISGGGGDRVLQLRTPFGGGKTHSLLALYHLLNSRREIDEQFMKDIPDPGSGRAIVLSGLDLDPWAPRAADGVKINTLWGEMAYRLGGEASYETIRRQDEEGSPPGGNELRALIGNRPVLLLLDEVLVYVQRAGGKEGDHPLRRQVITFLQLLTEVVRNLPNAAMVYSLQASAHEAAGEEALLTTLDHLVTRVDAKREPVSDEEVMKVVQRRLFPAFGAEAAQRDVSIEVAREYAIAYRRLKEAYAQTEVERRAAGVEAERFEKRILDSYPFHPDLLDLMYHRWGSLPSYQRTRGALQFLATVAHAVWKGARQPQPLIGVGDVPLEDERVRGAFFSQVGERERYTSVLSADITGSGARVLDVDRRIATDVPAFEQLRVGTQCATSMMLYSFGARQGEDRGVLESELVQSLVAPNLDRNVIAAALHDLREQLLYLHYTGRRYRFEPKANLNLLIAEETKKWAAEEVLDRVKQELQRGLAGAGDGALIWPSDSGAIPDGDTVFRIVYLGADSAELDARGLRDSVSDFIEHRGPGKRSFKNALAFAVPGQAALDRARTAARNLMGIESLASETKAKRVTVEKEQVEELTERQKATAADLSGAVERVYEQILIPIADRSQGKPFELDLVDLRAQLTGGRNLHERIIEGLRKHLFDSVTPAKLVALTKLGQDQDFVACDDLVRSFFIYFDFPKVIDERAIRDAISRGTADVLGYVSAAHVEEGHLVPTRKELVQFGNPTQLDEIDLGSGCYVLSASLAATLKGEPPVESASSVSGSTTEEAAVSKKEGSATDGGALKRYRLRARLDASQLFRIFPALQNLADKSSKFEADLAIEAESEEPFDKSWLRNAVEEHLEESGVDAETELS